MARKYMARCDGIPCFVTIKKGKACFNTTGHNGDGAVYYRSGCRSLCDPSIEWVDTPPKSVRDACLSGTRKDKY